MSYRAYLAGLCLAVVSTLVVPAGSARAQTTVTPYFMILVDTSGSMSSSTGCSLNLSMATCTAQVGCSWQSNARCVASSCFAALSSAACGAVAGCAWNATGTGTCRGDGVNSCGQPHTRLSDAKCVVQNVVNAYGELAFGFGTFATTCTGGTCASPCTSGVCGCTGCSLAFCDANAHSGTILAPVLAHNAAEIVPFVEYACSSCTSLALATGGREIRSSGNTPLEGILRAAQRYFMGTDPTFPGSPIVAGDPYYGCRPVNVILLTDGAETCGGTPQNAAAALRATAIPGFATPQDIRTYAIGLGIAAGDPQIEAIATAGGTDAAPAGGNHGFYATDETSIALAFSQIVADSILVERCDTIDNDCDTRIDEGFPLYCNLPSHPARDLCMVPAETLCNGVDDNCNGQIDEGLRNACGTCGAAPLEVCNLIDDDCDIAIDEGVCGGCVPSAELCNNLDDDCDGVIDMITQPCGVNVGICTSGTQTCIAGVWGTCSGTNPGLEICDNLDNDCDGVIDGQVTPCGSSIGACRPGSQICSAGTLGPCIGAIGPTAERCDLIDNNCNGMVDEGDPGGGGACGVGIGVCTSGTQHCIAGVITCMGGSSGSAELCNNLDDDCDGSIDEGIASPGPCVGGSGVGVCQPGMQLCMAGAFVCVGAVGPMPELCDNLDNDCDGSVDEGNPEGGVACGDDTGACMSGTTQCMSGMLVCVGAIGPTPEVCNAIDDDCNGVIDDGIPVGAPCGSSMGECAPGVFVCDPATGMLVCQGGITGSPELCDTLDNDCDGVIDESVGAGGPCGSSVGACMMGTNQCVGGAIMCVGEVPPTTETCDCVDNDCNGMTDDPPTGGSLCPTGSACIMCQCASMCQHDEFGDHCPSGTTPFVDAAGCHCVAPACDAATCGGQTLMDGSGNITCEPTSTGGTTGPCVCRNNACTFACEGVTCMGALVCNPRTGSCVMNDCNGLGCPTGQLCNTTSGACETDPCAAVTCATDQACRSGTCEATCASVLPCPAGQTCHAGVCSADRCMGVTCSSGNVCNPADGTCTRNMCIGIPCPTGQTCNPLTGTCNGDPCVGLHCPTMTECRAGECVRMATGTDSGVRVDAGPGVDSGPGNDAGTTTHDDRHRVLASGGGPICSVSTHGRDAGGSARALLALLAIAGVLSRRRARRGGGR